MVATKFVLRTLAPPPQLTDFVESFWMLKNLSNHDQEVIVMPDGRLDLFFSHSPVRDFGAMLMQLDIHPGANVMPAGTVIFAISFKLLAVEYLLSPLGLKLEDRVQWLAPNFLGISKDDIKDLEHFREVATQAIQQHLKPNVDERKKNLFQLLYQSNGSITVHELAEKVCWTSRQINRYFTQRFGIPLKTYANILRFKASFSQLKEGKLFPTHDFADQSHFIKEIRKFAGVSPKKLAKNQNDRFIQLLTLPEN